MGPGETTLLCRYLGQRRERPVRLSNQWEYTYEAYLQEHLSRRAVQFHTPTRLAFITRYFDQRSTNFCASNDISLFFIARRGA